jgi:fructokinase
MSFKVIGIGEVLWDLLPTGPQLGGAPANFAYHARALGAQAGVVSRVGNDSLGLAIRQRFADFGIANSTLQMDATAPTGTVAVTLSPDGIPNFVIREHVAWDRLDAEPVALSQLSSADAVCFGSLAQRNERSRLAIQRLVAATRPTAWRVFDVNIRQQYYSREVLEQSLGLANVLKLNDAELPILRALFQLQGTSEDQVRGLAKKFNLKVVALTLGAKGSLLYQAEEFFRSKTVRMEVVDTIGAGDAFTAALTLGLLHGLDLARISEFANQAAGFVCSCAGATPLLPENIRNRLTARAATAIA